MRVYLTLMTTACLMGSMLGAELKEVNAVIEPRQPSPTALIGGRLIDGLGGEPVERSVVVLQGSKIVSVGTQVAVKIPEHAKRLDVSGLTVLPGLIDSHFHSRNDVKVLQTFLLANGVTSFRDPGHPLRFYKQVLDSKEHLPRIFLCGAHLDAYPPAWPEQAIIVDDDAHARNVVNAHADRGASAIKIYFRLPLEHYRPICETAHARGIPVTAHLELIDANAAIEAGVRGIEHITSFGSALAEPAVARDFKNKVRLDPAARRKERHRLWATLDLEKSSRVAPLIELIVKKKVFVSPTLAIYERRAGEKGATELEERGFRNMLAFLRRCHEAGAAIVVGSHTRAPFAKNGEAYLHEMELLGQAGLSPMEILTAATLQNARFFRAQDRLGSIEPGKLADLMLVKGNPSEDIQIMKQVKHVMLNGRWIGEGPPIQAVP